MDRGVMSLNLKHDGTTTESIQVIMYASYSDVLKLDGSSVTSNTTF